MRIIDSIYGDTIYKIASDIIHQVEGYEDYVRDKQDSDDYVMEAKEEISELVELVIPVIQTIYRAFIVFVDDKIKNFVEKYDIDVQSFDDSKYKISEKELNALDSIINGLEDVEAGSGEKQELKYQFKRAWRRHTSRGKEMLLRVTSESRS